MCSTERSNAPPGHVKGVLEGREGGALVGVGVGAGWHKDMLFNHKVPWQQESTSLSYSFCFCPPPPSVPFSLFTGRVLFSTQEYKLAGDWLSRFPGGLLAVRQYTR